MFQLFRMLSFEEDPICCCFFVNHVFVFGTIWDFLRRCGKVVKKQTNMTLKITSFSASLSQFVGVSNVSNGCSKTILLQHVRGKTYTQRESQLWHTESSTFLLVFLEVSPKLLLFAHN